MNFTSPRLLVIFVTLISNTVSVYGFHPLLKECMKEIPVNPYETLGEQKIFAPQGVNVLDGQDVVEILLDAPSKFNKKGDEGVVDALALVGKLYIREKAVSVICSQMPEIPDKVQENPNLQYTLTLSLKTGLRWGLDFAIDSIAGTLYSFANSEPGQKK